jgi:hypothetical protein
MNAKGMFMKLVSLLLAATFVFGFIISCGGGGGGGASDPGPYKYADPDQAASASNEVAGTAMMMDSTSMASKELAAEAAGEAGYATGGASGVVPMPKISNKNSLAAIDPRLKTAVDKMIGMLQSASVKNATMKARQAKAMQKAVSFSTICSAGSGTVTITGTDNSDLASAATYTEATVTLTFDHCRDNYINYTEENGSMSLYWKRMIDGSSTIATVTATNYVTKTYSDSAYTILSETGTVNGTFSVTDNVTSGSASINANFNYDNVTAAQSMSLTMSNLTNNWTHETAGPVVTDTTTLNGSFKLSVTDNFGTGGFTITPRNMQFKVRTNTGFFSYEEWLNGSIVMVFSPADCASGTVTFTTEESTPLTFTDEFDECPNSGTVQVNNATIVFGTQIAVTVNGTTKTYGDCFAMDAAGYGMCM